MLLGCISRKLVTNFILKYNFCLHRSLYSRMSSQAVELVEDSMKFPFLEKPNCVDIIKEEKIFFILRGLPGSGKSTLAKAIAEKYKHASKVISADTYRINPSKQESLPKEYQQMDEDLESECKQATKVIVVDDTHHDERRLNYLYDLADQYEYFILFAVPHTPWNINTVELMKKTKWNLTAIQMSELNMCSLEQIPVPYYFGWFLCNKSAKILQEEGKSFWKQLEQCEKFKEELPYFSAADGADGEKSINLDEFFVTKPSKLHCTTKFCDGGNAPGSMKYASLEAVTKSLGDVFDLHITALFVTPRTAGAQVKLEERELLLWPDDAENEAAEKDEDILPNLHKGSRAHITLGCAEGISAVVTGFDLLRFISLKKGGGKGEYIEKISKGELHYFSKGLWMLYLDEEIKVKAMFGGSYHKKEQEKVPTTKKETRGCTLI
ncbi:2',3'-cyclic-nucleotide 3'-phosphodiesterase isoform X2 [Protopterus annectens]|uniref:2',3'-cyclic-nucleotide 3'-phosphodiesterase isoform X2 n=1 Tax=Protopterus annectens TaxID=7888 RepID=UPI001CFB3E0D|nr:2',3'-cyclic-nucleotide 3'-phosphodiesterase isoform X2 [Protopterus annectens]